MEALKKQIADKMVSILCKNLAIKLLYKGVVLCLPSKITLSNHCLIFLVQVTTIISDLTCVGRQVKESYFNIFPSCL